MSTNNKTQADTQPSKWWAVEGSYSHHCCFAASVVTDIFEPWDTEGKFPTNICETFQVEDADFIAESFTVYHETGMTPRELACARAALHQWRETLETSIRDYLAAQDALDNDQYASPGYSRHSELQRDLHAQRAELDALLNESKGAKNEQNQ